MKDIFTSRVRDKKKSDCFAHKVRRADEDGIHFVFPTLPSQVRRLGGRVESFVSGFRSLLVISRFFLPESGSYDPELEVGTQESPFIVLQQPRCGAWDPSPRGKRR